MPKSKAFQKCPEVPKPSLGPAFYRQSNVYTDFHGDVQHHHGSHTYVYFYSNEAALITNWTFKQIVVLVSKDKYPITHV